MCRGERTIYSDSEKIKPGVARPKTWGDVDWTVMVVNIIVSSDDALLCRSYRPATVTSCYKHIDCMNS